jgi:hypothetical protein
VNPFSGVSWFWRAWRGNSVTFATLFASGILGLSVLGTFRHLLSRWGAPWYLWLLLPLILVTIVARKEDEWLPDPALRARCARWLIFGSIAIVLVMSRFGPKTPVNEGREGPSKDAAHAPRR